METVNLSKWDIAVIDPPWPQRQGGNRNKRPNQTGSFSYNVMSLEDIGILLDAEILPNAASSHCVFMWTIDKYLVSADELMESRGYRRHTRLIWDKGNGIAPAFTVRFSHEYLCWYYKPGLPKIEKSQRGKWTSVIRAAGREHSRKPDEAYQFIDAIYPDAEKLDVFSREPRAGWQQWGDQLDMFRSDDAT